MARNMCNRVAKRFDKATVDIADQIAERVDGDDDTGDPSRLHLRIVDPGRRPLRFLFADFGGPYATRSHFRRYGCKNVTTVKSGAGR